MKILECSTKGDIRFSAFGAKVKVFDKWATIEEHYQLSKRFTDSGGWMVQPRSIYDVKGKNAPFKGLEMFCIEVNGKAFPPSFRMEFYQWMWLMYLDENPYLVEYASEFDDFNDIFKGKSGVCQADVIRQYIKRGRETIVADVRDFCYMLGVDVE